MEVEAWIKPVNSRLRFCLCIVSFSLLTEEFFCSIILLAHQLLGCSRRLDSGKCHSALSGSSTLVFFYHSHRFRLRLASVFTIHHSSLTNKTPWEHFQRLLILQVRFLVPPLSLSSPPPPPPPTVPFLANHRCNKTYWRLTP